MLASFIAIAVAAESAAANLQRAQAFLQTFLERAPDGHRFADAFHLRGERGVGLRKFLKGKARPISTLTQWTNWTNIFRMKTVNVHEAKTSFSSLLATVEDSSESFVICRNGEPVADLVPHKRASRIKTHPVLGKIKIKYDPIEPASQTEWPRRFR